MFQNFEEIQNASKANMEEAVKSFSAVTKSYQAIAAEFVDYAKKAMEDTKAAAEKVMACKSLDKAIEAQTEFAKSAYETAVARSTKIGELYSVLAKDAYKPVETIIAKVVPAK